VPGHLIVICGLPGAGKSTLARSLEHRHSAIRFSSDEWMHKLAIDLFDGDARVKIERLQWDLAQQLLTLDQAVIIEWGTWSRSERDELRLRAREIGASVELRYLEASLEARWERVQRRNADPKVAFAALTLDDLRSYETAFEPPDSKELALFDPPADDEN